jgi:hypothetical protein
MAARGGRAASQLVLCVAREYTSTSHRQNAPFSSLEDVANIVEENFATVYTKHSMKLFN